MICPGQFPVQYQAQMFVRGNLWNLFPVKVDIQHRGVSFPGQNHHCRFSGVYGDGPLVKPARQFVQDQLKSRPQSLGALIGYVCRSVISKEVDVSISASDYVVYVDGEE